MRCAVLLSLLGTTGLLGAAPARGEPMGPDELAGKADGSQLAGLPLFAYSADAGYGFGARASYAWNGHLGEPRFTQAPYVYRVVLQVFATSRDQQSHGLAFDAPHLMGSPYRVRAELRYEHNSRSYYYGLGENALWLTLPGSPHHFHHYDDYRRAASLVVDDTTYARYDEYDLLRPSTTLDVERGFAGDRLRVSAGVALSYARVRDYTGEQVEGTDPDGRQRKALQLQSRLAADCAEDLRYGCSGGRDNYLHLAVAYDTRDDDAAPTAGSFLDLAVELGTRALRSQFDYVRALVTARGYWSPLPDTADLVLAGRAAFVAQTNGAPFFSMNRLPFTDEPQTGLGGLRTLRGFRQDRFVGSLMALGNAELRWTWARAHLLGQRFAFLLVPLFDLGRPFDAFSQCTVHDWKASYGGAFRVTINRDTLVTAEYGRSTEDAGLYVNVGHIF